jgi:DNA-binding MarR family transcriptional regulator
MQSILANLERSGLLTREAHPDHGRIIRSVITARGRKALLQAHAAILDVEAVVMAAVGEREAQRLTLVLTRCAELLSR